MTEEKIHQSAEKVSEGVRAKEARKREADRVESDALPEVIRTVGHLSLLVGFGGCIAAFAGIAPWFLSVYLSAILSAPFLYGFADIVLSLRKICSRN